MGSPPLWLRSTDPKPRSCPRLPWQLPPGSTAPTTRTSLSVPPVAAVSATAEHKSGFLSALAALLPAAPLQRPPLSLGGWTTSTAPVTDGVFSQTASSLPPDGGARHLPSTRRRRAEPPHLLGDLGRSPKLLRSLQRPSSTCRGPPNLQREVIVFPRRNDFPRGIRRIFSTSTSSPTVSVRNNGDLQHGFPQDMLRGPGALGTYVFIALPLATPQYTPEERDPVPLCIHHMPICVSFSFFQQGTFLLVDPSEREERVMDGLLVIAMNKHREICTIQTSGGIMLLKDQILRCSKIASVKVAEITELIMKALENDQKARKEGGKFGFAESIPDQRITALKMERAPVDTSDVEEKAGEILTHSEPPLETAFTPILRSPGTAQIGEGLESSWRDLDESEEEEDDEGGNDNSTIKGNLDMEMDVMAVEKPVELIVLSESEEEEVVVLEPEGAGLKSRSVPQSKHQDNFITQKKTNKKKQKKPTH